MKRKKTYKLSLKQKHEEEIKYLINAVFEKCRKNEWKHVGITSSAGRYQGNDLITSILNNEAVKRKENIKFEEISPVTIFAESLERAKKCDSILLVESYGDTLYKNLDSCMALLEKSGIKVAGVIVSR